MQGDGTVSLFTVPKDDNSKEMVDRFCQATLLMLMCQAGPATCTGSARSGQA